MLACKRYVIDSCDLLNVANYPTAGIRLQEIIDPENNFVYVTSQSKYEIENLGHNFDGILDNAERNLNAKIHYVEISYVVRENAKILKCGLNKLHRGDDVIFAYCVTNKCILITSDNGLIECCKKVGCSYICVQNIMDKLVNKQFSKKSKKKKQSYYDLVPKKALWDYWGRIA
tara:strand:+ start:468 stop:986 length:519 start_codon:yes stop_codon:yes gene_type:complete